MTCDDKTTGPDAPSHDLGLAEAQNAPGCCKETPDTTRTDDDIDTRSLCCRE